jgi:hypothetical protein
LASTLKVNPSVVLRRASSSFTTSFRHALYIASSTERTTGTGQYDCANVASIFSVG